MSLADFPALLDRLAQGTIAEGDRKALEALVEAAPGYVTAHVALAQVCEREGDREQARRSWKHARLLLPSSPAVRAGLRRTAVPAGAPADAGADVPAGAAPDAGADMPAGAALGAAPDGADTSQAAPPPPRERAPEPALPSSDADLDSLIEELEGARIEPTPDPDDVPAPDLDASDGDVVSPTLARIYEAQGQLAEAARVHRRLAEEHPGEADAHRRQAEALEARAEEERGSVKEQTGGAHYERGGAGGGRERE